MWHKVRDEVGDGAFRRLAQKVDLELLARVAQRRLPRPHRALRLLGDGLVPRARPRARRRASAARPLVLGRHLLALGVPPGPRMGRLLDALYERQLDGGFATLDEGLAIARAMLEAAADGTGEGR